MSVSVSKLIDMLQEISAPLTPVKGKAGLLANIEAAEAFILDVDLANATPSQLNVALALAEERKFLGKLKLPTKTSVSFSNPHAKVLSAALRNRTERFHFDVDGNRLLAVDNDPTTLAYRVMQDHVNARRGMTLVNAPGVDASSLEDMFHVGAAQSSIDATDSRGFINLNGAYMPENNRDMPGCSAFVSATPGQVLAAFRTAHDHRPLSDEDALVVRRIRAAAAASRLTMVVDARNEPNNDQVNAVAALLDNPNVYLEGKLPVRTAAYLLPNPGLLAPGAFMGKRVNLDERGCVVSSARINISAMSNSPDQKTLLHELAQLIEQGDLNAAQKLLNESGYKKPGPSLS